MPAEPDSAASTQAPPGWRLLHRLTGHTGRINRIAWSPDGARLVSTASNEEARVWNVGSETTELAFALERNPHRRVVMSPDGRRLLSGDRSLSLWDLETGRLLRRVRGFGAVLAALPVQDRFLVSNRGGICVLELEDAADPLILSASGALNLSGADGLDPDSVAVASDGSFAVLGLKTMIVVLDLASGAVTTTLGERGKLATLYTGVALLPDDRTAVASNADGWAYVFDLDSGTQMHEIEGHTAAVLGVDVSPDGALVATKGSDGETRLWRCADWQLLSALHDGDEEPLKIAPRFHPTHSDIVATFDDGRTSINIWELDVATMGDIAPAQRSVHYATAKIALLGDSGVGKSALGGRIVHGEFPQTHSTHGEQFWVADELAGVRADGATCEAVLWDFAGQPDYRLVHALFLDDVDAALVLFDASDQETPLRGVDYWIKHMTAARGDAAQLLVGARSDRGVPAMSPSAIEVWCRDRRIGGGYVETSAQTGTGIDVLIERVRSIIPWDRLPATVTSQAFHAVKARVLRLKGERTDRPFATWDELATLIEAEGIAELRDDELRTAIGNLQKHGYVTLLRDSRGDSLVLLAPELLINLASSIVLEARRNPEGLGSLDEDRLRRSGYNLPELEGCTGRDVEVLVDGALGLFLTHALCFRERLGQQALLVFPSLVQSGMSPPASAPAVIEDVSYRITGAVENVYASLVVLLGYTNAFSRSEHWRDEARYDADGHVCAFRLVARRAGEVEIALAYAADAPVHTRRLFQGLFETYLSRADVAIAGYPSADCTTCGTRQERATVVKRMTDRRDFMSCEECGCRISLAVEQRMTALADEDELAIRREDESARRRTVFEEQLVHLKRLVDGSERRTPTCFVSYAWGVDHEEGWVEQLATDLRNAGVDVLLDRWQSRAIGSNIARFVTKLADSDYVLVVGTPGYLKKCENVTEPDAKLGSVASSEADLLQHRLTQGSESRKASVLPILLAGDPDSALLPQLRGRVIADFREQDGYFTSLVELLLTMFGLAHDDAARPIRDAVNPSSLTSRFRR